MTTLRLSAALSAAITLGSACTGSKPNAGDSTLAAAPDSTPSAETTPAPVPPPPAADSTSKRTPAQAPTPTPTSTPARGQPSASPTPTPSETVLTGRISVGGLAGQQITTLQVDGGKPARLVGSLEAELQRLNTATVWVAGGPVASPANGFSVTRYDVLAIDGAKPLVGVTANRAGAVWLLTGADSVKLSAAASDLTTKVGAKVWVVGRRTGADMTVQTFGIIRDP